MDAIALGDQLRDVSDTALYGALAALPARCLLELRNALRGAYTPLGRIS